MSGLLALALVLPMVVRAQPASADAISSKRAEAAHLATQINAQGQRVNALSEAYDAARISLGKVNGQLASARSTLARTESHIKVLEGHLTKDAVSAYVNQGAGLSKVQDLLQGNVATYGVRSQFLASVAGNEQSTVDSLDIAHRTEAAQQAALQSAEGKAKTAVASVASQRSQAIQASDALQATLSQVKGQLVQLVAQAQAAKAAAEARAVKARLAAQQAAAQQAAAQRAAAQQAATQQAATQQAATQQAATQQAAARQVSVRQAAAAAVAPGAAGGGGGGATASPALVSTPTPAPAASPSGGASSSSASSSSGASSSPAPPAGNGGASTAIAAAEAEVGKPYVYGAAGPNAFDCSGLVMASWAAAGVSLPHTAAAQWNATARVPVSQLQPGDLVFFDNLGHVGLYIGGGQMVVADNSAVPIRYASIYRSGLMGGGRVY